MKFAQRRHECLRDKFYLNSSIHEAKLCFFQTKLGTLAVPTPCASGRAFNFLRTSSDITAFNPSGPQRPIFLPEFSTP